MKDACRVFWISSTLGGALLISASALAQLPPDAELPVADEHVAANLPPPGPHWAYILDPVSPHLIATKIWIVDGDKLDVIGMVNAGYTANMAMAPDSTEFYVAETYWSRGTRGDRADLVTTFDARTLKPKDEVFLREGRFLIPTKKYVVALTQDGRYMLSFNMDPATSISVVDVKQQLYEGTIEIPGCALIYAHGKTLFSSLCADGSLLTVDFDNMHNPHMSRSAPFFDAENDPVFEHPGFARKEQIAYFVSYGGMVYPVDLSGDRPRFGEPWSLVSEEEKGTWWPAGWQVASYHPPTKRLFVQMHEADRWSHKEASEEIWVFDVKSQERLERIQLEISAWSSMVTQDVKPLLFVIDGDGFTSVYDATTYEHKGDIEETGISPHVIVVPGE